MRSRPSALIPQPRVPLDEKIAWDIAEVSYATGLSETFIKQLVRDGKLIPAKVGRRTLYAPDSVRRAIFGGVTADQTGDTP